MQYLKFEYIWLDGYTPEPNLRSKTKVLSAAEFDGTPEGLPVWSFDGSSTQQAEGRHSDCLLKPVRVVPDPARENAFLVMSEVLNPDGTPHVSNTRAHIADDDVDFWFGYEQEYVLMQSGRPIGFPEAGYPEPQGRYYCSVGYEYAAGRSVVEEHLNQCLAAGLMVTGINAEVLLGQWEFQLFGKGPKRASDDLWLARYLLYRVAEGHKLQVALHPKPVKGDWNGSGMHTNFSNREMREVGGEALMTSICESFRHVHHDHINVYGSGNDQRLTGLHETQQIGSFSYGVSDRGASIRIPVSVPANDWKGYLEDRRPAASADPYRVAARIMQTVKQAALAPIEA